MPNSTIKTYQDLHVYQNLYRVMKIVLIEIIPSSPKEEKFNLVDQLRRACKAPLALIAEGFAKRCQLRQWRKYLDDALGTCFEMINHLTICSDVYGKFINVTRCKEAISIYDLNCKQITRLKQSWQNYQDNK